MNLKIVCDHYKMLSDLKALIEKKTDKLVDKYFNDDADIKFVCTERDSVSKMELTVRTAQLVFKAEARLTNMYENLDAVLRKLENQVVKNRDKLKDKLKKCSPKDKSLLFFGPEEEALPKKEKSAKVVKHKKFELSPRTQAEAELEFNVSGHDFYVYLSKETNNVCVIYTRRDGNLGLIETTKV